MIKVFRIIAVALALFIGVVMAALLLLPEGTKSEIALSTLELTYGPEDVWPILRRPKYHWVDAKGRALRLEIGQRAFEIPYVYAQNPKLEDGIVKGAINLLYTLPGFKPYLSLSRDQRDKYFKEKRTASMLIQEASQQTSLKFRLEDRLGAPMKNAIFEGEKYGLKHYSHPKRTGKYGQKPDDTFVEITDSGVLLSFLRCSPPGKDVNPGCSHQFIDNGILYKTNFRMKFHQDWKELQEGAIEFLNRFEVNAIQESIK